ncbi:hypothetical protein Rsub_07118 [Raphidocelis subcapitata]|uniref:Uncharacterized protein n=1 Tax=Raphidocelis subcapitata TaxID=307507 RepID=A0A2V0P2M8_9CHLO|nr:hypothetical protein Rsub_07118 [Raphidocelis subcapitata]|eukprot:GBF94131.1 hypothetical protein Rsub_07118 [Raphidocelis subcapitata]
MARRTLLGALTAVLLLLGSASAASNRGPLKAQGRALLGSETLEKNGELDPSNGNTALWTVDANATAAVSNTTVNGTVVVNSDFVFDSLVVIVTGHDEAECVFVAGGDPACLTFNPGSEEASPTLTSVTCNYECSGIDTTIPASSLDVSATALLLGEEAEVVATNSTSATPEALVLHPTAFVQDEELGIFGDELLQTNYTKELTFHKQYTGPTTYACGSPECDENTASNTANLTVVDSGEVTEDGADVTLNCGCGSGLTISADAAFSVVWDWTLEKNGELDPSNGNTALWTVDANATAAVSNTTVNGTVVVNSDFVFDSLVVIVTGHDEAECVFVAGGDPACLTFNPGSEEASPTLTSVTCNYECSGIDTTIPASSLDVSATALLLGEEAEVVATNSTSATPEALVLHPTAFVQDEELGIFGDELLQTNYTKELTFHKQYTGPTTYACGSPECDENTASNTANLTVVDSGEVTEDGADVTLNCFCDVNVRVNVTATGTYISTPTWDLEKNASLSKEDKTITWVVSVDAPGEKRSSYVIKGFTTFEALTVPVVVTGLQVKAASGAVTCAVNASCLPTSQAVAPGTPLSCDFTCQLPPSFTGGAATVVAAFDYIAEEQQKPPATGQDTVTEYTPRNDPGGGGAWVSDPFLNSLGLWNPEDPRGFFLTANMTPWELPVAQPFNCSYILSDEDDVCRYDPDDAACLDPCRWWPEHTKCKNPCAWFPEDPECDACKYFPDSDACENPCLWHPEHPKCRDPCGAIPGFEGCNDPCYPNADAPACLDPCRTAPNHPKCKNPCRWHPGHSKCANPCFEYPDHPRCKDPCGAHPYLARCNALHIKNTAQLIPDAGRKLYASDDVYLQCAWCDVEVDVTAAGKWTRAYNWSSTILKTGFYDVSTKKISWDVAVNAPDVVDKVLVTGTVTLAAPDISSTSINAVDLTVKNVPYNGYDCAFTSPDCALPFPMAANSNKTCAYECTLTFSPTGGVTVIAAVKYRVDGINANSRGDSQPFDMPLPSDIQDDCVIVRDPTLEAKNQWLNNNRLCAANTPKQYPRITYDEACGCSPRQVPNEAYLVGEDSGASLDRSNYTVQIPACGTGPTPPDVQFTPFSSLACNYTLDWNIDKRVTAPEGNPPTVNFWKKPSCVAFGPDGAEVADPNDPTVKCGTPARKGPYPQTVIYRVSVSAEVRRSVCTATGGFFTVTALDDCGGSTAVKLDTLLPDGCSYVGCDLNKVYTVNTGQPLTCGVQCTFTQLKPPGMGAISLRWRAAVDPAGSWRTAVVEPFSLDWSSAVDTWSPSQCVSIQDTNSGPSVPAPINTDQELCFPDPPVEGQYVLYSKQYAYELTIEGSCPVPSYVSGLELPKNVFINPQAQLCFSNNASLTYEPSNLPGPWNDAIVVMDGCCELYQEYLPDKKRCRKRKCSTGMKLDTTTGLCRCKPRYVFSSTANPGAGCKKCGKGTLPNKATTACEPVSTGRRLLRSLFA